MTGVRSAAEPTLMGETERRLPSIEGRTPRYMLVETFAVLVSTDDVRPSDAFDVTVPWPE